jgi:hypothetical protein
MSLDNNVSLQPIKTKYAGHFFRSRLEARWAVFFDSLKVRWEYEKEGFNLDGTWYLPDFYLPHLDLWVEIKPEPPEGIDHWPEHIAFDYFKHGGFVLLQGRPTISHYGKIGVYERGGKVWEIPFGPQIEYVGYVPEDCGSYYWCECPECGLISLQYNGRSDRSPCKDIRGGKCKRSDHGDKGYNRESDRLVNAYLAATYENFESQNRE